MSSRLVSLSVWDAPVFKGILLDKLKYASGILDRPRACLSYEVMGARNLGRFDAQHFWRTGTPCRCPYPDDEHRRGVYLEAHERELEDLTSPYPRTLAFKQSRFG
jgi:hypothetical protein